MLEAVYGVLRAGCWPGLARRWRLPPPQIECWCRAMQDTQHFDVFAGLNKHLTTVQIGLRAAAGLLGRCARWNAPVGALRALLHEERPPDGHPALLLWQPHSYLMPHHEGLVGLGLHLQPYCHLHLQPHVM